MDLEFLKHPIVVPLSYIEPKHVFGLLGQDHFLFLGGTGRYQVLALDQEQVNWQSFLELRPGDHLAEHSFPIFHLGFIGVLPYRECDAKSQSGTVFRVNASLIWDTSERRCFLVYARNLAEGKWLRVIGLVEALKKVSLRRHGAIPVNPAVDPVALIASQSDGKYLQQVREAIADIHAGRFYQINLLRYFSLAENLTDETLFPRFMMNGGPHAAFFQWNDQRLVSFSPERFVRIEQLGDELRVKMQPIKGSRKREGLDVWEREQLLGSGKDQAELNIIIDLARNDLHAVSKRGSVKVESTARIESFPTIHHLVADVAGTLRPDLNFGEIFSGLLPAASITGAPKKEVCEAIRDAEQRPRGYFMGNIFYWDPGSALFDSSVLIRTIHGRRSQMHWNYEYAAGSGIVADSNAENEMNEINIKTRVLTGGA